MVAGVAVPAPTLVEHSKFRIVIMDSPSDSNASTYVENLQNIGITDVVRTCEPSYDPEEFEKVGIRVHELPFPDGEAPPPEILQKWLSLLGRRYKSKDPSDKGMIAVHCVAGLGRAPVMAAVALVEMTAMHPFDAVEKIRDLRKGAINARQLKFLQSYKRATPIGGGGGGCGCVVS
eukprot:TRINITY_DN75783_c0_g1_i1.p1 TRINITY_DN75783_c0_g1~~TRINITY_DN75783_c0_g1_i1.p1  ORF type:complete len:176 (+),score=36.09 TRINITY_DN75783_c0_g1_i1:124-651(+)